MKIKILTLSIFLFTLHTFAEDGILKLKANVDGVQISVDSKSETIGTEWSFITLPQGNYRVEASKQDYQTQSIEVSIRSGRVETRTFEFKNASGFKVKKPTAVSVVKGYGDLTIVTDIPGAAIKLNGQPVSGEVTPITVEELAEGKWTVEVTLQGKTLTNAIQINPDQLETIHFFFDKTKKKKHEQNIRDFESKKPIEGKNWTEPSTGMEFVWISAVNMWVGKYEVTNSEYKQFNPDHSYSGASGDFDFPPHPITHICQLDAVEFATKLTELNLKSGVIKPQYKIRLPTKKEFLLYVRCGDNREYFWGNNLPPLYGNFADYITDRGYVCYLNEIGYSDGYRYTCPVKKSGENAWGLYGVGGNVKEFIHHDKKPPYQSCMPAMGGCYMSGADKRDLRDLKYGGCFGVYTPSGVSDHCGFRLVMSASNK